jgi:hypothetical protein
MMYGVLRLLSPEYDTGQPDAGRLVPETNMVYPISHETTTLGSDLRNAIVLYDDHISPEHAILRHVRGKWDIVNHSQDQVLFVNDVPVTAGNRSYLSAGDRKIPTNTGIRQHTLPGSFRSPFCAPEDRF